MFLVAWKNILVFFFEKKVVRLLLVLCHLFDSLLLYFRYTECQEEKNSFTKFKNFKKDQKPIHDKVVIAQ